jgi:hypothetical protein
MFIRIAVKLSAISRTPEASRDTYTVTPAESPAAAMLMIVRRLATAESELLQNEFLLHKAVTSQSGGPVSAYE